MKDSSLSMSQQNQVHPLELKNAINDTQTTLQNLVNTLYKAFTQQNQNIQVLEQELQKLRPIPTKKTPEQAGGHLPPKINVNTKKKKQ